MERITLALWAMNMGLAPSGPDDFMRRVVRKLDETAAAGGSLLLLPEYMSEAWLSWAPRSLPETREVAWMAGEAEALLPRMAAAARERGIALLAGTAPARIADGCFRNRAHLFLPDGRSVVQDKLTLTPDERDPEAWTLEPGDQLAVVEWNGLRLATVICLDIEQPSLAARLQTLDLDLVLVPSDTGRLSGYSRVFACARARAVELFACVAAVGGVGPIAADPPRPNVSGAGVYLPCEEAFGFTGTLAETAPSGESHDDGNLLVVRDVPVGEVRRRRHHGGEVWIGPWSADAVRVGTANPVKEPAPASA